MAMNFPDSPSVNDTYTVGDRTWIWNGTTWDSYSLDSFLDSGTAGQLAISAGTAGALWEDAEATLAAGSAGQLVVSAGTAGVSYVPTGVEGYTALAAGTAGITYQPVSHNYIINGAFDVWQRGTSGFTNFSYSADRWLADNGSLASRSTDAPEGFDYSIKMTGTTGTAGIRQGIELGRVGDQGVFADGTTWTLSFYVKASAERTLSASAVFRPSIVGAVEKTAFSASSFATATTSWQRVTHTFTIPAGGSLTSAAGLMLAFSLSAVGDAVDVYFTGVQLEAGSVATPFKRHAPSLQGELAACQRYYQKIAADAFGSSYAAGYIATSTSARVLLPLSTPLRTNPTMVVSGTATISFNGTALTPSSYSNLLAQANGLKVHAAVTGAVGNHACSWNFASGVIELDAEL